MTITVTHAFVSSVPDDPSVPQEVRPSNWNAAHVVTGAVSLPLPFFGTSNPPWVRPSLNIGGPSTSFNTWLNQGGQVFQCGSSPAGQNNFNNNNGSGPAITAGTVYAPGDTVTISGGTGTPAILTITDTQSVSAAIVTPGASGTPGTAQVIGTTGAGTMFVLDVVIGVGGGISSITDINQAGDYTTNPTVLSAEPVNDNSSSGITGAVVSVVMGALAAAPSNPGRYTVNPTNPVSQSGSSGSGTGATWDLSISAFATATDGTGGAPLVANVPLAAGVANFSYLTGVLKPTAFAPPWTVTVAAATVSVLTPAVYNYSVPIILYDDVAQKAVSLYWSETGGGGLWIIHSTANMPGTLAAGIPVSPQFFYTFEYFAWFRVVNDGTNLTFYYSAEGILFLPFYTESVTAFTSNPFDYIGFGGDRSSAATGGYLASVTPLWNFTQTSP